MELNEDKKLLKYQGNNAKGNELQEVNKIDDEFKNKSNVKILEGTNKLYDDLKPKIKFSCYLCGMSENCHYNGIEPPFVSGKIQFCEESYVIRNPFSTPPPLGKSKSEYFIIIGAHCKICKKLVCKDLCCSFFYLFSYCLNCIKQIMTTLPKEVQVKAKKQISNIT